MRLLDAVVSRLEGEGVPHALIGAMALAVQTLPPVVTPIDLVLQQLYAGGPRDRADIHGLLDLHPEILQGIQPHLVSLPGRARDLWSKLLVEHQG